MTITLYQNISPKEKVSKTITIVGSALTGILKKDTSIIDPSILIEASTLPDANYMYIADFNRYYFINNIICNKDSLFEIQAHVDVLMSNANVIKGQKAIIAKQQNKWNLYLNDPDYRTYSDPYVITKAFPSGFNSPCYILTLRGGHT